jgi:hypothetical protein
MNKHKTIIISVALAALVVTGTGVFLYAQTHSNKASINLSYAGRLTSIDTSAMATDGPGVYLVDVNGQKIIVHLDAGESACDRDAIKVPDVKVGDSVRVKGDKGSDGIVRICKAGTYITANR